MSDRSYFTLLVLFAVAGGFAAGYYGNMQDVTVSEPPVQQIVLPNGTPAPDTRLAAEQIFPVVEPSVVSINVARRNGSVIPGAAQGSGIVYDTRGHIVTNAHVVNDASEIRVTFLNGKTFTARPVGQDIHTDLAVIKVDAPPAELDPLAIGQSRNLSVGQPVLAVGNPFGLSGTMTKGIISQLGRRLDTAGGFSMPNMIQTDAAINPGNSGGPLINEQGEAIGINTAIESRTGTFSGIGLAIPAETVKRVVPALIEDGEYKHSWIGVRGNDVTPRIAEAMGLDEARGFLVVGVAENGPAADAGIQGSDDTVTIRGEQVEIGGDVIIGIDGEPVRQIDDILTYLARHTRPGDTITVTVIRDGTEEQVALTLAERPQQAPQ